MALSLQAWKATKDLGKVVFHTTGWQFKKFNQPKSSVIEEIGGLVNEEEELTNLVNEEGGEAKDSLLLNDRANLLEAGYLQLPGKMQSLKMDVAVWDGISGWSEV